jgi:hypothetical protein
MEDFIPDGYSRIRVQNNSFCSGCYEWFTKEERINKNAQLLFFGDPDGWFIYVHPQCVEILFERGVLYYKDEEHDDAN